MLKMPGQSTKVCSLKAKPIAFNSASSVDCESESRGDREGDSFDVGLGCIIYLANFLSSVFMILKLHSIHLALHG